MTGGTKFLLCVGAQKAATTWFYRYLKQHPDCAFGAVKELAVFQSVFQSDVFKGAEIAKMRRVVRHLQSVIEATKPGERPDAPGLLVEQLDNLAMNFDLERYWSHFRALLAAAPDAKLTGDITPAYAGLEPDHLAAIRNRMLKEGYTPRALFLMRDPIERIYSMLRMGDRNNKESGKTDHKPAHLRFVSAAKNTACEVQTRYERTIENLETVFPPDELRFEFYETFLNQDAIDSCCDFLGIGRRSANFQHRANSTVRETELTQEAISAVRDHYEHTYTYCAERFGVDKIRSIWKHY